MRSRASAIHLCLGVLCRISLLIHFTSSALASPRLEVIQDFHEISGFTSNTPAADQPPLVLLPGIKSNGFPESSNSLEIPEPAGVPSPPPKKKLHKRVWDSQEEPTIQSHVPEYQQVWMALLTTIDGDLHCINKGTGDVLWTRSANAIGAVVSSNVTRFSRNRDPDNNDLLGSASVGTRVGAQLDGDVHHDSENWTFIVEPAEVPTLYVYSNTSGLQPVGSLVRLVKNSPHVRPDGKRITGGKTTRLIELELTTGVEVDAFESETGCTGPEGLKGSGSGLTIILGQAEYTLCILDPVSGMQWDIFYSEYFPVSGSQNLKRVDPDSWVGGYRDNWVGYFNINAGIKWRKEFNSPAVSVFEVFMDSKTKKVVLAKQKKLPEKLRSFSRKAYVGIYKDQLYVQSKENYPLLDLEAMNQPYLGIEGSQGNSGIDDHGVECQAGSPQFPDCVVGVHMIGYPFGTIPTMDGESDQEHGEMDVIEPGQERNEIGDSGKAKPPPNRETYDPFPPPISMTTTIVGWLIIIVGVLTGVVYTKGVEYLTKPVDGFLEERGIQFRVRGLLKTVSQGAIVMRTAARSASSVLRIGDRKDTLPAFNDPTSLPIRNESEQIANGDQRTSLENAPEWNEKDSGSKKGPRNKASEPGIEDRKTNNANGTGGNGGGNTGNGGGGRKKKRGAGGKGQKAAAAAAAAAAADTTDTGSKTALEQKDSSSSGSAAASSDSNGRKSGETVGASSQESVSGRSQSSQSNTPSLTSIQVTEEVLGYGSHGTVVYKGTCDGRPVAVKRLLIDFYDVAFHEVRLLQESDDHANVVRYFRSEQCDRFLYIALELCSASLDDLIERGRVPQYRDLLATLESQRILYQIISGIHHLHTLKIVHRDIKPQNILIAEPRRRPKPSKSSSSISSPATPSPQLGSSGMITGVLRAHFTPSPATELYPGRVMISDFGLCRKLENDQSSFNNTGHGGKGGAGGGTIGWRAPECFTGLNQDDELLQTMVNGSVGVPSDESSSSSQGARVGQPGRANRMTRAIDIFSAGCVFYYVLTNGDHPFGDRYSRERNILLDRPNVDRLDSMGQEGVEVKDLISRMIAHDPADRPDAFTVMLHPYFWSANKRLMFMQDCSDRFEKEDRETSPLIAKLEHNAMNILGRDWYRVIDRTLVDNLGKYRKYDGNSVRDLLRALRNKKHHYQDLPQHVQRALGELPDGFLNYFTSRFPKLMLHLYYIVANDPVLRNEKMFGHYFVEQH